MRVLLLNQNCDVLNFIKLKRAIKLIVKDKVEVLSYWKDNIINFSSGFMKYPAILRMKKQVYIHFYKIYYSREMVLKRDYYTCQYCSKNCKSDMLTIDHIIPKYLGGISSFLNCVAACRTCNLRKGKKTLEQAGMSLIKQPYIPSRYIHLINKLDEWHDDWEPFL